MTAPHPWALADQAERRRELEADPGYCRKCGDICHCDVEPLSVIVARRLAEEQRAARVAEARRREEAMEGSDGDGDE